MRPFLTVFYGPPPIKHKDLSYYLPGQILHIFNWDKPFILKFLYSRLNQERILGYFLQTLNLELRSLKLFQGRCNFPQVLSLFEFPPELLGVPWRGHSLFRAPPYPSNSLNSPLGEKILASTRNWGSQGVKFFLLSKTPAV